MQKNKVNQWLENIYKGIPNQEVLFFNTSKSLLTQYNIANVECIANYPYKIKVCVLDGINKGIYGRYSNLIIVSSSRDKDFELIKKYITRDVIYVDDIDTMNNIVTLFQAKKIDEKSALKYTLLQKMEFEEVLKLDVNRLREFVLKRSNLLENIHYNFGWTGLVFLEDCLEIYNHRKILVASFAQYLYRLVTLNFISTDKSVGATIHKTLGVQSSIISPRALNVIPAATELRKNLRVYNLNENQVEIDIKISIAKKLVALDIKELDISKIANITELPIKKIEKFYRDCFTG